MNTAHRACKTLLLDEAGLGKVVEILMNGGIVGIPTETVYGLAGNAFDSEACASIFRAKGRPSDNPLIVHIGERGMLGKLVNPEALTPTVRMLMDRFWPGPLTFLLPKLPNALPDMVTCGLGTVGVRMPDHPLALRLIREAGVPLAAPSANSSGKPSPTTAQHVLDDLDGKIPAVLDGGPSSVGLESTVLDMFHPNGPTILRPGGVPFEDLLEFIPNLKVYSKDFHDLGLEERPSTPGMKYKHYSPDATVILFEGPLQEQRRQIHEYISGSSIPFGYMRIGSETLSNCSQNTTSNLPQNNLHIYELGSGPAEIASKLYDGLRWLDSKGVAKILVEGVEETREGLAIMNRLEKAATQIIHV